MKKKISKKGFTLVELLAVIVIIGVLLGIAIPNISKIIARTRNSYYSKQEDTVSKLMLDYLSENRSLRPNRGTYAVYCVETLVKANLMEPITGYNKSKCDTGLTSDKAGYVVVYRRALDEKKKDEYEAQTCLICEGDKYKTKSNKCDIEAIKSRGKEFDGAFASMYNFDVQKYCNSKSLGGTGTTKAKGEGENIKYADDEIQGYTYGYEYYNKDRSKTALYSHVNNNDIIFNKDKIKDLGYLYEIRIYLDKSGAGTIEAISSMPSFNKVLKVERGIPLIKIETIVKPHNDLKLHFSNPGLLNSVNRIELYSKRNKDNGLMVSRPVAVQLGGISKSFNFDHYEINGKHNKDGYVFNNANDSLSVYAVSNIGYKSKELKVPVNMIYKANPTCEIHVNGNKGDNDYYKSTVSVSIRPDEGSVAYDSSGTRYSLFDGYNGYNEKINITADGKHNIVGHFYDNYGNMGTCSATLSKDTEKPSCQISNNGGILTVSGRDNISGVSSVNFNENHATTINTNKYNKPKTYIATVKDKAGNKATCSYNVDG